MKGSRLGAFLLRCMGRLLKNSLVNQQFAQLPALGKAPPLVKTVMPFPVAEKEAEPH